MLKKKRSDFVSLFPIILLYFAVIVTVATSDHDDKEVWDVGPMVPKDQRRSLVSTEYGEISAAKVTDGINGSYYLQFITLEPNALFLPVILHADMVFYVQTGSGRLTWIGKNGEKAEIRWTVVQRGDILRLQPGNVFFLQSNLNPQSQNLRISAIFADSPQDLREPVSGPPYSSIRDLVTGFDKKILQVAFQVAEEVVEEITSGGNRKPLVIVPGVPKSSSRTLWEVEAQSLFGRRNFDILDINKKKKRLSSSSVYNILTGDRDVENRNGWSSTVTPKQLRSLRGSSIGIFMVNLTKGAMMGPHWNPVASEIAVVVEGQGVVQVVCPSIASERVCQNTRVRVKEGDVFVVPRFHPMAQMSFNNGTFVFVGFTTTNRNNRPKFLAGRRSVLQTLDKQVLAESFNVSDSTIGRLLTPQRVSVILECASCAEAEEGSVEEEIEKGKKEEEKRKQEEEARKREEEEEEEKKSKEKEEEKRQEEARRKKEEEAKQKEEQAKQDERRRQEAAREEEEEEMEKQQQEGEGGGSHGKKEPEYWPGGPEEGRIVLNNVWMG